jgi:hypothetical protein
LWLGDVQLFGHGRLPASIDVACSVCRGEVVSEFAKSMDVAIAGRESRRRSLCT